MPAEKICAWAATADRLYAADSGALPLLEGGYQPTIVGDMDSLHALSALQAADLHRDDNQDYSDCDKLLMLVREHGFTDLTLIALEGDRLDHMLGTLSSVLRSGLTVRLGLRRGLGWIAQDGFPVEAAVRPGQRFSVLPLQPVKGARIEGAHWPVADAEMQNGGFNSLSNRSAGEQIHVSVKEGAALVIVEYSAEQLPLW
jgi:thiamine pyrophosphokinase